MSRLKYRWIWKITNPSWYIHKRVHYGVVYFQMSHSNERHVQKDHTTTIVVHSRWRFCNFARGLDQPLWSNDNLNLRQRSSVPDSPYWAASVQRRTVNATNSSLRMASKLMTKWRVSGIREKHEPLRIGFYARHLAWPLMQLMCSRRTDLFGP